MGYGVIMYSNGHEFGFPDHFLYRPDFLKDDELIYIECMKAVDKAEREHNKKHYVRGKIGEYYVYGFANTGESLSSIPGGSDYCYDIYGKRPIRFFIGVVSDCELANNAVSDEDLYRIFLSLLKKDDLWDRKLENPPDTIIIRESDTLIQSLHPVFVDQSRKREMILYVDDGSDFRRHCVPDLVWNDDEFVNLTNLIFDQPKKIQRYVLRSSVDAFLMVLPVSRLSGADLPGTAIIGYVLEEGDGIPYDSTVIDAVREQIVDPNVDPILYRVRSNSCQIPNVSDVPFTEFLKEEGLNPIPSSAMSPPKHEYGLALFSASGPGTDCTIEEIALVLPDGGEGTEKCIESVKKQIRAWNPNVAIKEWGFQAGGFEKGTYIIVLHDLTGNDGFRVRESKSSRRFWNDGRNRGSYRNAIDGYIIDGDADILSIRRIANNRGRMNGICRRKVCDVTDSFATTLSRHTG